MQFNIELKARCTQLERFREKTVALPHTFEGERRQTDTFFVTPKGRLKLRESDPGGAVLIPYLRKNQPGPRQSDYSLLPVKDAPATRHILSEMFGVRVVVKKIRSVYIYKNVRIHLDQVENLGNFVEFEAVVRHESERSEARQTLDWLVDYFAIKEEQFVPVAYADLLLSTNTQ
jgi:predicted adenylyl cyclase CyaB